MILPRKMRIEKNIVKGHKVMLPHGFFYACAGNVFLLFFIFASCVSIVLMRENFLAQQLGNFESRFYEIANDMGFVVNDIIVEGRKYSTRDEIVNALKVNRGDNIIKYDLWQAKRRLEELPWIKEASVRRSFFPNIIYVSLKEKKAIAVWQINNDFYPIDEDGFVINTFYIPKGISLLVVGKKAPDHLKSLLKIISEDEQIKDRIKVAQYISERRWNIILDDIENGVTIKLPEEGVAQAWKKLIKLNTTEGILKRKLTFIDLRLPDKVVVKLSKEEDPATIKTKREQKL